MPIYKSINVADAFPRKHLMKQLVNAHISFVTVPLLPHILAAFTVLTLAVSLGGCLIFLPLLTSH